MMDEYISREVLLTRLLKCAVSDSLYGKGIKKGLEIAEDLIKRMPYIEVVRCKDCEHRSYKDGKYYECPRHFATIYVKCSDFCSYGKRKDDAE